MSHSYELYRRRGDLTSNIFGGKEGRYLSFSFKLIDQIKNKARNKKHCYDENGEETSNSIFQLCKEDTKLNYLRLAFLDNNAGKLNLNR